MTFTITHATNADGDIENVYQGAGQCSGLQAGG